MKLNSSELPIDWYVLLECLMLLTEKVKCSRWHEILQSILKSKFSWKTVVYNKKWWIRFHFSKKKTHRWDLQHFLIDSTKYEFVALCQISHRSQIVVYEKQLSTTSGLMSTVLLTNIDISSLSLIFSTDSQEPSHTTLNGLLFDTKIPLVLLNEFIHLSGPVKMFLYHYIVFQGAGLSYGALTTSNCATINRLSQILTKKQEEYSSDHELRSWITAEHWQ